MEHAFRMARDQRVPVVEWPSFVDQSVGAGLGQPVEVLLDGRGRQNDAFGHELVADRVLAAAAAVVVEQAAGDVGECDFAGVLIFQFQQAAATASRIWPVVRANWPARSGNWRLEISVGSFSVKKYCHRAKRW